MAELSIIIPARQERFLARTVKDLLDNMRGDSEVIAVCDGDWPDPPLEDHPRLHVIYCPTPVGQRAATNKGVALSRAKYVAKTDAHCAFAEGFDVTLMEVMQDDWTLVPIMKNLHAFNWVCKNGHERYQGPSGECKECGEPTEMDVIWYAKRSPNSTAYCFDTTLHFQYFNEFKKRPEGRGPISETMSLQGSFFMMRRDRYTDLNILDESFGIWGQMGTEVACKSWLSGGRVVCCHDTWYAHMFRTQGGSFGFPYPLSGQEVERARQKSRDVFFSNAYKKQIYPLSWLVEKFKPVKDWHEESGKNVLDLVVNEGKVFMPAVIHREPSKGIIYYTDNKLDESIMRACQEQLIKAANGIKIVSISLKPIDFGENIHLDLERGYLTLYKQILAGLEAIDTDIVFHAEHDVLYSPSHFDFTPTKRDVFYYNLNMYRVRLSDGFALHYDAKQVSGLCAYRELLLDHYRKRVARTEKKLAELGDSVEYRRFIRDQGHEAGTHNRAERVDDCGSDIWRSEYPNLDIRHKSNLTPSRWRQDQFRNKSSCQNWIETTIDRIPGWENLLEIING